MKDEGFIQLIDFRDPNTLDSLAAHVGISARLLDMIASDERQSRFYDEHHIPKRRPTNGTSYRIVWQAASQELQDAHKKLNRKFESFARRFTNYPSAQAHGYIRKRSTLTNAQVHAGSRWLLRADIKDFFASITTGRLEQLFLEIGLHSDVARLLACFATIDGHLPLGLHASPLFSNLICLNLDQSLATLASRYEANYTRYSDDLTFSSNGSLPSRIELESCVAEEGFQLSPNKFRVTQKGQAHYVTGLSVSDPVPRIPREFKRRIRQELYYAHKYGLQEHLGRAQDSTYQCGVNRIDGSLRYINAIEHSLASRLYAQWLEILERDKMSPSFAPRHERSAWNLTLLIDEAEIPTPTGISVLALGCVAIEDMKTATEATEAIANQHLYDPFTSGDKRKLRQKGLHYTDASEEMRTDYVRKLGEITFSGYLAYAVLPNKDSYESVYIDLLSTLLPNRLIAADRADVTIVVEQNSHISSCKVGQVISTAYERLESRRSRRPLRSPTYKVGKKNEDPCLAVVDFVLGVFTQYALLDPPTSQEQVKQQGSRSEGETPKKRFERLRDKIRVIISKPTAETFLQKRPFLPWIGSNPMISRDKSTPESANEIAVDR